MSNRTFPRRFLQSLVGARAPFDSQGPDESAHMGSSLWRRYWTSLLGSKLSPQPDADRVVGWRLIKSMLESVAAFVIPLGVGALAGFVVFLISGSFSITATLAVGASSGLFVYILTLIVAVLPHELNRQAAERVRLIDALANLIKVRRRPGGD